MSSKITTARLIVEGERFEILVKPDEALDYKMGKPLGLERILAADIVYSDASKGQRASSEKLKKHFRTDSVSDVAQEILKKGELQLTSDQRKRLIDDRRKQIIAFIAKNFVDPRSGMPHPPLRIEQALGEARVSIEPFKPAEEQAKLVAEKLRALLPLKAERVRLRIRIPAQFSAQSISILRAYGEMQEEHWGGDGSLTTTLEVAPGAQQRLLDRLGSLTKGMAEATVVK